jgi:hypothetical protein
MNLEDLTDSFQFDIGCPLFLLEQRDGVWCSDSGDNILALGVHEEFAVENLLSARWVTSEGDA